ncbi:MAG: twin-arginine translocase TatA/TatE family subunit [Acidobacteriales bacterium]|nr:twin-arginine translocase TatA/TatE family subunit [Terriglobales bacterium]
MNLGITEMIFLAVIGLLLFGPKKLPEIGRQIGKAMAEFKRAGNEFQSQLNDEVRKLESEVDLENTIAAPPSKTAARGPRETVTPSERTDYTTPENNA